MQMVELSDVGKAAVGRR